MLQDLQGQLNNDQKSDDNTYNAKNGEYNAHIAKLDAEINKLTGEIAVLAARIEELAGLIHQAEINIKSFVERMANLRQSIEDLKQKFADDTKYYTTQANGLQELNVKLLLVNTKLGKMIGSASGVDIYNHINKTQAELRDIAYRKEHPAHSFIQLSKSLPLATAADQLIGAFIQADQAALQKLMGIIAKFAQQALTERQEALDKLENARTTFEALNKQMHEEIKLNAASKAKQEKNKAAYEHEKAEKETEKKEKEDRKEALEKEKQINLKLQQSLTNTYNKEKHDRAEEIGVVQTLVGIVQRRLMH